LLIKRVKTFSFGDLEFLNVEEVMAVFEMLKITTKNLLKILL
jgi:hypothetical protein